jgi:signal transduction histidine kinase/ActR/RegA family two-component response regulator
LSLLARLISVESVNRTRALLLPGTLPLGQELLASLATAIRHSFIAACFSFGGFVLLNGGRPGIVSLLVVALVYFGLAYFNSRLVRTAINGRPNIEMVQTTFLRSFAILTIHALILALVPWLIGPSLTAYGELLTSLIVIAYCLLFAVMHSVFPLSVLSFSLINCISVAIYWTSTHYDFKWPVAALTLVFFAFLLVATLNVGRVLRKALSLQVERDEARLRAEDAALGLEKALAKIKSANLEKLRLFSAANHDLRQPISAISLFVGVLQRKLKRKIGDDEEVRDLISKLDRNLQTLDVIVGSLSDITALETGGFSPRSEVFELKELIEQLIREFEGQIESTGTILKPQVPELHLFSDPRMLARIVRNALDNALKHAGGGTVIISIVEIANTQFLSVRDDGPGIPEDMRQQVVDAYVQLDNPERDRKKGYGLGLSIAKRMAEALGSNIELHTPAGGGLEFSLEIGSLVSSMASANPVQPISNEFDASRPNQTCLKIAVIDDDDDIRAGLEALFENWGHEVLSFASIEQTSRELAAINLAQRPDHVFIDNWLPDGRGLDAVSAIRALCPEAQLTLLTGDSDAKTFSQANELHIQVLLKPVTAGRLWQVLLPAA